MRSTSVSGRRQPLGRAAAPPAEVTVLSIAASSEPSRAPLSVRVSSRFARVAASISTSRSLRSRDGLAQGGRAPIWVRST